MFNNIKKLDARSKWQLEQTQQKGPIEVLIRLDEDSNLRQTKDLELFGCRIGAVAGNILSATIDTSQLEELSKFPFIKSIQFSRSLFME